MKLLEGKTAVSQAVVKNLSTCESSVRLLRFSLACFTCLSQGLTLFQFSLICDPDWDLEGRTDHGTKMPSAVENKSATEGITFG
jgi:hypothetical protein